MSTNKCSVRQLKMTSSNENLPIFKDVVIKSYIKTTLDDQYINLPYHYPANGVKVEVKFKGTSAIGDAYIISTSSLEYISKSSGYITPFINGTRVDYFNLTVDEDMLASYDTSNGNVNVNNQSTIVTPVASSLDMMYIRIWGRLSQSGYSGQAGKILIKEVKVTIGEDVHTLVPATVNNVAVLYDNQTGEYYEANTGDLIAE